MKNKINWVIVISFALGFLLLFIVVSCVLNKEQAASSRNKSYNMDSGQIKANDEMQQVEIQFSARYIRTGSPKGAHIWQAVSVVSDKSGLEKYCSDAKELYLEIESSGLRDLYSEDWFAEHQLVIVAIQEGETSGPQVHHKVVSVIKQGDECRISINKIIPIDAKEDSWHILIEVDKGTFPLDCKFSIDLKEMSDYSFYKKHTDANNSGCSQIAGVYFHYFQ